MPITEIPPRSPAPVTQAATPPGSDLYDAGSWESAYREMHDVPALLIQLQDDLARSRKREAFWISVIVHVSFVILIVDSDRLLQLFPRRSVFVVSPSHHQNQKHLPYLALRQDDQKFTKRP